MATFFLLHGAFCHGWVWRATAEALMAGGHRVEAPDLPSSGADAGDLGGLQDDVAVVARDLQQAGPDMVLLVGHSGAGMLLTELAGHPAVRHSVYVAALHPQRGQSTTDMLGGQMPSWMDFRPEDGVVGVCDDPDVVRRTLCADVEEERFLREVYPRYLATSVTSLTDASSAPAAGHATTYVVCERDEGLPPAAQEAMASAADRVERLPSSHSPMLSMPERLAQVLDSAASAA
jgi:pimeloyl-ACP methyl ester carboxylesterase